MSVLPRPPAIEPRGQPARLAHDRQALRILIAATLLSLPLMILAILATPAVRPIWDNLHWSVSAIGAALATAWSIRGTTGRARVVRRWGAVALGLWMLATLLWAWMNFTATASVPSIVDVLIISIAIPGAGIIVATVRGRMSSAEEAAVYLDGSLGLMLVGALVVFVFGPTAAGLPTATSVAAMVYPTGFLGVAGAGLVALLAVGYPIAPRGPLALLAGVATIGLAYLGWLGPAMTLSDPGPLSSLLFTIGTLVSGYGAATWRSERSTNARYVAFARVTTRIIGPVIGSLLLLVILLPAPASIEGIIRILVFGGAIVLIFRQGLIVRERTAMLATVTELTRSNRRLVGELRRELEERARNESRSIETARADAVGSLSASVGHEVNNPLTGVLGYAELVLAELPTDHPSRPDVETIRSEALRARDIVAALRNYARPRPPHIEPTNVPDVVRRAVLANRSAATRAGIVIEESLDEMELVLVDGRFIERAVSSIIENACHATSTGGTITIGARRSDDGVVITVTDDGIGMEEVTARRAFEPFHSAWPAAGDARPATGLGLSIANGLIGSLGGKITLDSSPGRGTTVEIRLAAAGARAEGVLTEGVRSS